MDDTTLVGGLEKNIVQDQLIWAHLRLKFIRSTVPTYEAINGHINWR